MVEAFVPPRHTWFVNTNSWFVYSNAWIHLRLLWSCPRFPDWLWRIWNGFGFETTIESTSWCTPICIVALLSETSWLRFYVFWMSLGRRKDVTIGFFQKLSVPSYEGYRISKGSDIFKNRISKGLYQSGYPWGPRNISGRHPPSANFTWKSEWFWFWKVDMGGYGQFLEKLIETCTRKQKDNLNIFLYVMSVLEMSFVRFGTSKQSPKKKQHNLL